MIVDDDALARASLRKMLEEITDVEILPESSNGHEAISFIQARQPDVVFLEAQMPEVSGFDMLRALPVGVRPAVVFVTASDQFAIEAFELNALDYLLKPIAHARLLASVERVRRHREARHLGSITQHLTEQLSRSRNETARLKRIAVKTGNQTSFIRIEDVDYIESAGNYTVVLVGKENHVLRETLTNLEDNLPPEMFLRISRSIVVNLERIKSLQTNPKGESTIVLQDNRQLKTTRSTKEIQNKLQYAGPKG